MERWIVELGTSTDFSTLYKIDIKWHMAIVITFQTLYFGRDRLDECSSQSNQGFHPYRIYSKFGQNITIVIGTLGLQRCP